MYYWSELSRETEPTGYMHTLAHTLTEGETDHVTDFRELAHTLLEACSEGPKSDGEGGRKAELPSARGCLCCLQSSLSSGLELTGRGLDPHRGG